MNSITQTLQTNTIENLFFPSPTEEAPPLTTYYNPGFNIDFTERLLGKKNGNKVPRSTQTRLDTMQKRLTPLIHPRVSFGIYEISKIEKGIVSLAHHTIFHSHKMAYSLKGAKRAVIFIATIGRQIDAEINNLMRKGELANAYVADALGSGAVERLVEQFQKEVAAELFNEDQEVGLRFSPGYCDWPITEQTALFSLLDSKTAGVKLGKTCLMDPRKSVSAIFGIYDQGKMRVKHSKNPCMRCAKKDCIARRTAVAEEI
ncbi:MAG: hypothetical protein KAR13_01765 [Desulfobulbaceae bacterium]|nr:hypothetical protein [Desulfobulbaceae bacterium]MCK5436651.1 hypothetical protein [Desulfobulbaceae bacterium]MCK5544604.1 hypothetical protein [Desulfobulbaceae bacterium]